MKKLFTYLSVIMLFSASFAQSVKGKIYNVTDVMPEYPGGTEEMMKFIQSNMVYPTTQKEKKVGGKVFVKFVVDVDGKIKDAEVLKGSGEQAMDDEALRVVNSMPTWKPGTMKNKTVPVYFNIPFSFGMPDPYFVFNPTNTNEHYLKGKKLIEDGNLKEAITVLSSEDLKSNLDAQYNLAVAYFWSRDRENSCKCFKTVIAGAEKESLILNNTEKFSKFCN